MKVMVRLAMLVAALLLVVNIADACNFGPDICYDATVTDENGNTYYDHYTVCIYGNGQGSLFSQLAGMSYALYMFGGGPGWFNTSGDPAFGGKPRYTTWIARVTDESGFLQPIGDGVGADGYMLTGEGESGGTRYTVLGMRVPCNRQPKN
jgi:hypothetical protein